MKFKCHFHDGEGKLLKESKFLLKKQIMENQKKGKTMPKISHDNSGDKNCGNPWNAYFLINKLDFDYPPLWFFT